MVHLSDLDWKRPGEEAIKDYKKGDMVKARFSMSTSRRSASRSASSRFGDRRNPMEQLAGIKKGDTVTCDGQGSRSTASK